MPLERASSNSGSVSGLGICASKYLSTSSWSSIHQRGKKVVSASSGKTTNFEPRESASFSISTSRFDHALAAVGAMDGAELGGGDFQTTGHGDGLLAVQGSIANFVLSAGHHRQVRISRLHTCLGQHAMNLPAMMGLVIEEMRYEEPARLRQSRAQGSAKNTQARRPANPRRDRPPNARSPRRNQSACSSATATRHASRPGPPAAPAAARPRSGSSRSGPPTGDDTSSCESSRRRRHVRDDAPHR